MSTSASTATTELNDKHQILRSTRLVTFITLFSRALGYLRDLALALLLGTSLAADAFVIAFRIPNLLRRLMGEGALTNAFIPVFVERQRANAAEAWDFARRMFWTLAAVLAGITLLGILLAPAIVRVFTLFSDDPGKWGMAVLLTRITFPYCLLIALSALAGAALNAVRVFGLPASVPIYLNLAMIGAAFVAWRFDLRQPAAVLAGGVVVGGLLQLAVQLPALRRLGMPFGIRVDFHHPGIRRVAQLMVPAVAGVGLYQINVLVSTVFATSAWVPEGSAAALYYADRVMELVLGAYAITVATVILPFMSQQAAEGKKQEMRETLTFALRNVSFIVIPAAAGLIVLGGPIVRVLFEHRAFSSASTALTADALLFYAAGLPALAAVRVIISAFAAAQDTKTPVRIAAAAAVVNIALCFLLVKPLAQGGLALATSLAAYVNLALLYLALRSRGAAPDSTRLGASLARGVVAAAGMSLVCWYMKEHFGLMAPAAFSALLMWLLLTIAVSVGVYLALAWGLRAEEIGEVYTLLTGRASARTAGWPSALTNPTNNS